jgi:hypothetical protein
MDPVEEIAAIATRHDLPMHVDACVGGFMLPWVEKLGYNIPPWDFRVNGVTSVSADVHKFGFGAKGASVLVYKNMKYLHHQFMVTTDYAGGIYISPTLLGSRAGGPIAAAWASLKHLGENGYLSMAKKLMDGTQKLLSGLTAIPGIRIVGTPCMNIISYTTRDNSPDIYVIADQLEDKGWMVERQQLPDCIHLTTLPTNVEVIDEYLSDLKAAYAYGVDHPEAITKGNAAVYGLIARVPFRGMVEKSVKKIMEDLYGDEETMEAESKGENDHVVAKSPAWMGMFNRLLSVWTTWKQTHNKTQFHSWIFLIAALLLGIQTEAQPFVDPFQVRYMNAYSTYDGQNRPFEHLWAGSDLPIKLNKNNMYLLLSPYYEIWRIKPEDKEETYSDVQSIAFPVGLIVPISKTKWSFTVMPTMRVNGEKPFADNTFQYGGATLITFTRKPLQSFRLGVYTNKEFFGWFIVPLVGVDWRLNEKNYLFGILPGRLTYEHEWNESLYGGATFRAPTSSFRLTDGQYIRLDDQQLSLYLDYYAAKHICFTFEGGYGIFRKIRTGLDNRDYLTDLKWGNGPFIKLSGSYRIRL